MPSQFSMAQIAPIGVIVLATFAPPAPPRKWLKDGPGIPDIRQEPPLSPYLPTRSETLSLRRRVPA
jgi:hypothetical protein